MLMERFCETELVRRAALELEAFGELVEQFRMSIQQQCYRRVHDWQHAEDLAQEVFVRAYRKLTQLDDPALFAHWLRKIASNVCSEFLRDAARDALVLETLPESLAAPARQPDESLLARLPVDAARCLALYYQGGFSYAEIAVALGISVAAVKGRLSRAKALLRKEMATMESTPKSAFTQRVMHKLAEISSDNPAERARAVGDVRRSLDDDRYAAVLHTLREQFTAEELALHEWERGQLVRKAIKEAKRFRRPEIRDALVALALHHPYEEIRMQAAGALVAQRDPAAAAALQPALEDAANPPEVLAAVKSTIKALERLAPPPAPDAEPLLLRQELAGAASEKTSRVALMRQLITALRDPSPKVRNQAVKALEQLGDKRAAAPLITLLDDPAPGVRQAAARALGTLHSVQAVPALIRKAEESPSIRHELAYVNALGDIGDPRALPVVLRLVDMEVMAHKRGVLEMLASNGTLVKLATRDNLAQFKSAVEHWETLYPADYCLHIPHHDSAQQTPAYRLPLAPIRAIYGMALAKVADARDVPDLLEAFEHDPDNAHLVAALCRLADPCMLEAMTRHLLNGNHGAAEVLVALGAPGLEALKAAIRSTTAAAREAAVRALFFAGGAELIGTLEDAEAIGLLEILAEHDPASNIRMYAKSALLRALKPELWQK